MDVMLWRDVLDVTIYSTCIQSVQRQLAIGDIHQIDGQYSISRYQKFIKAALSVAKCRAC